MHFICGIFVSKILEHKIGHKMSFQINNKKILDNLKRNPKKIYLIQPKGNRSFKFRFYYGTDLNQRPIYRDVSLSELDYFNPPTNPFERQQNKETAKSAQILLDQVRTASREKTYPILKSARPLSAKENDFIKFYQDEVDSNTSYTTSTVKGHLSVIKHLKEFIGHFKTLQFDMINSQFIVDFYNYMLRDSINTKGKKNASDTAGKYHRRFYNYLAKASRIGMIDLPPENPVKYPPEKSKSSEYLTKEELQDLANTPEEDFTLRSTFLFSCFTGLAHQELKNLNYSNIHKRDNGDFEIHIVRQKTGEPNKIPLSAPALDILEKRKQLFGALPDDKVFKHFNYSSTQNDKLQYWVDRAGIPKKITYHCGRHTFSAHHYLAYRDIGVLRNLLGHKDLSTTQRYINRMLQNIDADVSKMPVINLDNL